MLLLPWNFRTVTGASAAAAAATTAAKSAAVRGLSAHVAGSASLLAVALGLVVL